jgi:hypothetical protein
MAVRFEKPASSTFKAARFVDLALFDPLETNTEGKLRPEEFTGY